MLEEGHRQPAMDDAMGTGVPPTEVRARAKRRTFSAKYKLRILKEADACTARGSIGALLRREGLYSSHLSCWRRQREEGALEGLTPRQRGRKQRQDGALREELDQLRRDKRTLERRLEKAETIIEVQRKLCTLLGMEPGQTEPIESG